MSEPITLTEEEKFRRAFHGKEIKCLDHGFVRVVDTMGRDMSIVQAARTSYGDGTKSVLEDNQLIGYLLRHLHTTPFEMCEIKLHCKMPIFIARQWIRHRTANVNEYSGRYSVMKEHFYAPDPAGVRLQSNKNKQGGEGTASEGDAQWFVEELHKQEVQAYKMYTEALDRGIEKGLARVGLPLNNYTEWYWKIDLHNLMRFLGLRMDSHAQYEIQVFANAIAEFVKEWCPVAWAAFEQYQLNAVTFSWKERKILADWMSDQAYAIFDDEPPVRTEFSKGEWREFGQKINNLRNA